MTDGMARWLATAAVALFVLVGTLGSSQGVVVVVVSAIVAIGATLLMQSTGPSLAVLAVISGAAIAVLCTGSASNIGWFALCVLAGWCALKGGPTLGVGFAAAAIVVFVVEWAALHNDPGWAAWIAGTIFATVVCLMGRRQRDLIDQLRLAQAGLADRARVEERNRIARELHDVIAHSLTVSLLHVTSARLSVEDDPVEAAGALAEAERLGRQSLTEVRLAVGLLRSGDAPSDAPLPGVSQVPALVDGFRRAGVQLRYEVLGEPAGLSSTTGLTVYRILQEALTNAARHAPGTQTCVQMDVSAERTVLTIDSGAAPGADTGNGVGLHSMRERAAALGGTVEAGPSAAGWRVRAVLPRESVGGAGTVRMIRVLLVDDQELIRTGLRGILRARFGFEIVGELDDGAGVAEAVERLRPDVVVMDVRMPIVDGVSATAQLRRTEGAPPVLVLTTFEDEEVLAGALRAGANGFLLKGVPAGDLQRAVRTVAAGGSWLDPAVTGRVLAAYRDAPGQRQPDAALAVLTAREREVLALIGSGLTNAEIAEQLVLGEGTIKTHIGHVFAKLQIRDRAAAVVFAFDHGLVSPR